jgi:predicted membrane protein
MNILISGTLFMLGFIFGAIFMLYLIIWGFKTLGPKEEENNEYEVTEDKTNLIEIITKREKWIDTATKEEKEALLEKIRLGNKE